MNCSVAQLYKPPAPMKASLGTEHQVLRGVDKGRGTEAPSLCPIHFRNDQAVTEQYSCSPLDPAGAGGARRARREGGRVWENSSLKTTAHHGKDVLISGPISLWVL